MLPVPETRTRWKTLVTGRDMGNDICFVLCSCDSYEDLWTPFCTQLVKFWPGFSLPIYLGTESKTFHYDGLTIESPLKDTKTDLSLWSKRLEALLKKIPYDYLIFMLDDFLLTEPVNVSEVERAYGIIKDNPSIGMIQLWPQIIGQVEKRKIENAIECEYPGYYLLKKKMPYRITTQVSIWRKDYMLKILRKHESAWHFELLGTIRSRFYREKVLVVKDKVMNYPDGGVIWRGKCCMENLSLFPEGLLKESFEKRGGIHREEYMKMETKTTKNLSFYWGLVKSFTPKLCR